MAEKTVTRCVSAEIPQRVSDIDAWRRVSHCRESPSQVSRSDQEKITSQEAKPDEIKSTKSARNMSRSMQGNLDEGESFVSSIQLERSESGRSRVTCGLNAQCQGSFFFRRETIVAETKCATQWNSTAIERFGRQRENSRFTHGAGVLEREKGVVVQFLR